MIALALESHDGLSGLLSEVLQFEFLQKNISVIQQWHRKMNLGGHCMNYSLHFLTCSTTVEPQSYYDVYMYCIYNYIYLIYTYTLYMYIQCTCTCTCLHVHASILRN